MIIHKTFYKCLCKRLPLSFQKMKTYRNESHRNLVIEPLTQQNSTFVNIEAEELLETGRSPWLPLEGNETPIALPQRLSPEH